MNKMKKFALIAVCAALLVCVTVGATVAWLTSTDKVENTFTTGNVKITLDEADVNEEGVRLNTEGKPEGTNGNNTLADRVQKNDYHLLPGCVYVKDPMVHVDANSEDCFVFVKIENGLEGIEAAPTIKTQIEANGWTALGTAYPGVYYKSASDNAGNTIPQVVQKGDELPVFGSFTIGESVDGDTLAKYKNAKVTVTAYAIQFANLDTTAEEIWQKSGFGA